MKTKSSWSIKTVLLVTCILSSLAFKARSKPVDSEKSGEEQVKDAVRKAEAAASLAAEHSVKRTHKTSDEMKINKLGSEIEEDSSLKEGHAAKKVNLLMNHIGHSKHDDEDGDHSTIRVKEHRVHRKPSLSHLMGMTELGDIGNNNSPSAYKEDTKLEDRLALEAEEEKKYEDGYGGSQWEDGPAGGSKGGSWSTNIQRQDAAEKQSIQAQVASESAHELNEIQQAVAAESQSSRGATSLGDAGASVVQIGQGHNEEQTARFRDDESGPRGMEATASFEAPHIKSYSSETSPSHMNGGLSAMLGIRARSHAQSRSPESSFNPDLSTILRQSTKLSASELQGPPKQFSSENLGSLSNFGGQSISRYTQGSQESVPMEMSNSYAGSEASQLGNGGGAMQLGGATMQEVEPSQKESAYSAGAMQGASMEGGGNPIEIGGNNMQGMQNMGSMSAGFTNEQQQQPLVANMPGMMGGGSLQSLGAAAANGLTGMQAYGNVGGSMGGLQSFGGMPMTFKKRSKTEKHKKDSRTSEIKERNAKKSNLSRHHHRRHHHKKDN